MTLEDMLNAVGQWSCERTLDGYWSVRWSHMAAGHGRSFTEAATKALSHHAETVKPKPEPITLKHLIERETLTSDKLYVGDKAVTGYEREDGKIVFSIADCQ